MEYKIVLTNYLQQLLYISQEQSDLYILVTTVKGLTCSNYKVIADGFIKLEAIIIHNYTHHLLVLYITYVVALKVRVWCAKVLWACSMQLS